MDVGVIGLGIMGSAMAGKLLADGEAVAGYDVDAAACERFESSGGRKLDSPGYVAAVAPIVLLSLPSASALAAVVEDCCDKGSSGTILVECSTLAIADKQAAHDRLSEHGMHLLDCPISGTGFMATTGDLVMLASGDEAAVDRCRPVFDAFSRATHYLGPFGNGMKMKLIANLLVAIHNTAAAEALVLAKASGLDVSQAFDVLSDSAGTSRMFEIRGPMMVEERYQPPTMKIDVWRKDLDLIGEFAESLGSPTPLFSRTEQLYRRAEGMGLAKEDTAAVKRVLDAMRSD